MKQVNEVIAEGATEARMSLNIGCGADAWGDVRVDKDKKYCGSRSSLNLVGDAEHLPFRDKVFEEVRAYHVLEHLLDWKKALKEWTRVSPKIDIKIPKEPYMSNGIHTFLLELTNLVFLTNRSLKALNFPEKRLEHKWAVTPQSVINILEAEGYTIRLKLNKFPLFKPLERIKKLKPFLPRTAFEYEIVGFKSNKARAEAF